MLLSTYLFFLGLGIPSCFGSYPFYVPDVSMKIEIKTTTNDDVLPTAFNITCTPEFFGNCAKEILAIRVSRNGSRPLATLKNKSEISYNRFMRSNVEATGQIGGVGAKSWMSVVFSNVVKEDSGMYACTAIYLDESGNLQQEIATKNVSVEHQAVQDIVRHLLGKLSSVEMIVENLQNQLLTKHQEQQAMEIRLDNLQNQLATQDREHHAAQANHSFTCAFTAGYDRKDRLVAAKTLVFGVPLLNIGNAFNTDTGVFTAPKTGLYVFHLTLRTNGINDWFHVDLKQNGMTLASVFARVSNDYGQSSASRAVVLQSGDKVRPVTRAFNSNVLDSSHRYNIFSGYLLKLL